MRRPSALPLLLACLVVLAGCNGLAAGGDDTEMPSVTPADVPPDLHGGSIAPGLTRQQVVNADALLAAHRERLANESYTVSFVAHETAGNGTVLQGQESTGRYSADRTRFATSARLLGNGYGYRSPDRYDQWSNGTAMLTRTVVAGEARYERPPSVANSGQSYHTRELERLLDEFSVTSVRELGERGDHDAYALRGTIPAGDGSEGKVRLVVDERGLVHEFSVETTRPYYRNDGVTVTTNRTTRYVDVGTTTVRRPDWVAAAVDEFASREYVAPGVTTERVVSVAELRTGHVSALHDRSVTRYETRKQVAVDGTVLGGSNRTLRLAADRTTYRFEQVERYEGEIQSHTAGWSNDSVGYVRYTRENRTDYHRSEGDSHRGPYVSFDVDVEWYGETTVTDLGDGRYRVVVSDFEDPNEVLHYGGERTVTDLRVAFVVRESGLVERHDFTYTYAVEHEERTTVRVTQSTRFADIGTTTVDRPDWLSAAANATSR